jgi:hypothetical protein
VADATAAAAPLHLRDRVRARNDRADRDHAAQLFYRERKRDDGASAVACVGRVDFDCYLGRSVMSADIIRFIPRPGRGPEPTDFPTIAFRLVDKARDLVVDHADTEPCEYVPPENDASA